MEIIKIVHLSVLTNEANMNRGMAKRAPDGDQE